MSFPFYSQFLPDGHHFLYFTGPTVSQTMKNDLRIPTTHWALSRDGRGFLHERITARGVGYAPDIWRIDFTRGVRSQLTTNPVADTFPVWSPNGQHFAFTSNRLSLTYDIYVGLVDKLGGEELLLASSENKIATDWSADGHFVLYRDLSADPGYDIWAVPVDSNGKKNGEPIVVARTPADERDGQFSPDGKWVAYQSNESGSFEIYVQPFPGPGAKYQISRGGGSQVRWNPNGKELFYVAPDARLMSVPKRLDSGIEAVTPVPMFVTL
jgi:Tol biopolymer transport system component